MPATVGIIDSLSSPPFAALQPVRDEQGPYTYGDYTLPRFFTSGAFLLPAGYYDVGGVYGVLVVVRLIPVAAGVVFGWNDPQFAIASGDYFPDRIAQICVVHHLPITGTQIVTDYYDVHRITQLFLWPVLVGSGATIGLHVNPGFEVDLFFMCVL